MGYSTDQWHPSPVNVSPAISSIIDTGPLVTSDEWPNGAYVVATRDCRRGRNPSQKRSTEKVELVRINRPRLTQDRFMPACGPTALLTIVLLMTVAVACTGTRTAPPSETAVADIITEPNAAEDTIDGATWILETVDGQPPIAGTYLTLTISGSQVRRV